MTASPGGIPIAAAIAVLTGYAIASGSKPYSSSATESCLRNAGARVIPSRGDFIAQTAIRGTAEVRIGDKTLSIAFGQSSDGADEILGTYRRFGGVVSSTLYRKGSAVLSWYDDPGSAKSTVDGCLR